MSTDLHKVRAHYASCREVAFRTAAIELEQVLGFPVQIGEWSNRARDAYETQWEKHEARRVGWDWKEIFRRYRDPDGLNVAIWSGERLAGLLAATTSSLAVVINFFEGDPRQDCPLKGRRILVALDVAARYAQARGREELRVEPLNSTLENLYRDVFGFEPVRPRKGVPYYAKKV